MAGEHHVRMYCPRQGGAAIVRTHLSRRVELVEHATPRGRLVEDCLKRAHGFLLGQVEAELVLDLQASAASRCHRRTFHTALSGSSAMSGMLPLTMSAIKLSSSELLLRRIVKAVRQSAWKRA